MEKQIIAKNKDHLKQLIDEAIEELGPNCDLNFIDVSRITDMSGLFMSSRFNGDISKWDVSNVEDMLMMFAHSDFDCTNGDISQWEVPNLKSFNYVFYKSNVPRQIIARFNAKEKYKPGLHLTKNYPIRGMMYMMPPGWRLGG